MTAQSPSPEFLKQDGSADDRAALLKQIAEQKDMIAGLRADLNRDRMEPRERNTLVKLVATMAIKKYGFRRGKATDAAKKIEADTIDLEVRVGQATVRKYILEGEEEIPRGALND